MRVEDVMSRDVVTVSPETPLKRVAELLVSRRISGVPVVDAYGQVIGVVSESDILYKEREPRPRQGLLRRLFRSADTDDAKFAARTAGDAMTSPAVTAHPTMPVYEAATIMLERGVDRLVVVKGWSLRGEAEDRSVAGMVTRGDCVRAFARSDEAIADEIRGTVAQYGFLPHEVRIGVSGGEVALDGEVARKADADDLARAAARVPGVVSVTSNLTWRLDETAYARDEAILRSY